MANVYYTNFALQSANHAFSAIWKLSRALKKSGWTYKAGSDGVTKETAGVTDPWGNSADPSSDTYVTTNLDATYTSTTGPWIVLSTPGTLKVPFTSASTGTFLRGEKVTQATSSAEGELVGYDFDGTSTGHIVLIPRTGTFDNTNVITGASSGATLTPSGTIVTFVKEVCFWKQGTNLTGGSIYIQNVDVSAENTSRFSYLAANAAGVTATVCPGGGGTSNGLPTAGTYVMLGTTTAGTSPTITHASFFGITANMGKAQIVSTNAIGSTGVSPDLTWWIVLGDTISGSGTQMIGHFRLDNTEDGDLDLWATYTTTTTGTSTRLAATTSTLVTNVNGGFFINIGATSYGWRSWRKRGFASGDAFTGLATAMLGFGIATSTNVMGNNTANPDSIASTNTTNKRVRDKIWLFSVDNTLKVRKGTPRWLDVTQIGTSYDTLDTKLRFCIFPFSATVYGSGYIGPWDTSTVPLQS